MNSSKARSMEPIHYIKGDALQPVATGNKIIAHVCNDIGWWGKGFVLAISKKWKQPEQQFKQWYKSNDNFQLGEVQFVQVTDDTWVANIIGQHEVKTRVKKGVVPVRYEAIAKGLEKVAAFAATKKASVHMPRIGCGLAGGTWDKIEPLITDALASKSIPVTVYDL